MPASFKLRGSDLRTQEQEQERRMIIRAKILILLLLLLHYEIMSSASSVYPSTCERLSLSCQWAMIPDHSFQPVPGVTPALPLGVTASKEERERTRKERDQK